MSPPYPEGSPNVARESVETAHELPSDELMPVRLDALADGTADHRVQAGTVTTTSQHPHSHASDDSGAEAQPSVM